MNRAGTARGFTLLETLLALTLLAVAITLLFGSLRVMQRSWDAGEDRAGRSNHRLLILGFLRGRLADAQPLKLLGGEDEGLVAFDGLADSLEFVTVLPVAAGRPGPHKFNVHLERREAGGQRLVLEVAPYYPVLGAEQSAVERVVLLEAVQSFRVAYFGANLLGRPAGWIDTWRQQLELPDLVRLAIVPEGDSPWPVLVVHLRAHELLPDDFEDELDDELEDEQGAEPDEEV